MIVHGSSRSLSFSQKLQTEISLKEYTVRSLVDQARQDINQSSQGLENLISNWSNLQKKVDAKVAFYTDLYRLHEELKSRLVRVKAHATLVRSGLLQEENIWLDQLQNRIYTTTSSSADAGEIAEELEVNN